MWHHPKYYEEMKRNGRSWSVKRQATSMRKQSDKHQASSDKRQAPEQEGHEDP
jgi:phage-related protein